ncbi:ribose-phosphate pyrophosphokinase [Candidatus Roizmanbacteria bacterium]|nr:ribose-phosphate pyrophosphokinase [Candidatus Roizmanbacteria bacterium]
MKLFSGTANKPLAAEVAKLLNIQLSSAEVVRFDNSEVRVHIEENVQNETCVVIQPTANPTDTNLMELYLYCDALKRQEAKKVIAIIPYFGYARQNIQHRDGECVSSNVVIRFLEAIGFDKVYTFDLHDEGTSGVFSIPFKNLSAFSVMAQAVKKLLNASFDRETIAIASPDQGGIERARNFGIDLFGDSNFQLTVVEKHRDQDHIHQSKALDLYGDVKGKTVILVDDIVTSGGTLIHAAELAKQAGATSVIAAIVHHDFSITAPQKIINSQIETFVTSNSILLAENQGFEKLKEVSLAPVIAEELKHFLKS